MKNLGFILLLSTLTLFSCRKEEVNPVTPNHYDIEACDTTAYTIMGKTYVLTDGEVYLENMDTGAKTKYNHFDDNKTVSGMRLGNYENELERLELDVTTWYFKPKGNMVEFVLDGDSLNPYELDGLSGSYRIIEHRSATIDGDISIKMGGSSKPLGVTYIDSDLDIIEVIVHEAYQNIDGVQYTYFNKLIFTGVK